MHNREEEFSREATDVFLNQETGIISAVDKESGFPPTLSSSGDDLMVPRGCTSSIPERRCRYRCSLCCCRRHMDGNECKEWEVCPACSMHHSVFSVTTIQFPHGSCGGRLMALTNVRTKYTPPPNRESRGKMVLHSPGASQILQYPSSFGHLPVGNS